MSFRYVFLGLAMRSSWANDHATTYRALLHALGRRGHDVVFLEQDQPVYASTEDVEPDVWARLDTYGSITELFDRFAALVREADLVVIGSRLAGGCSIVRWALELVPQRVAFYDLDPSTTLAALDDGGGTYMTPEIVARLPLYLSTASGAALDTLRRSYAVPWVRPLLPSVDPDVHFAATTAASWDLGMLCVDDGEHRADVDPLLAAVARSWTGGRFVVGGALDATDLDCPSNIERRGHIASSEHRRFYGAQRFSLHTARSTEHWAPTVRLFEAAACGTPIISEPWPGLDELFAPRTEVFLVQTAADVVRLVRDLPEGERLAVAAAARRRVLLEHAAVTRAETLERYTRELLEPRIRRSRPEFPMPQ